MIAGYIYETAPEKGLGVVMDPNFAFDEHPYDVTAEVNFIRQWDWSKSQLDFITKIH